MSKVNILTNIYFVRHSRYMADGFASEYQDRDNVASDSWFSISFLSDRRFQQ